MQLPEPLQIVQSEFDAVDQMIQTHLDSRVPLVSKIGDYLINSGGKRVRPMLVLLACGALGYSEEKRLTLAAVIEYLHTATLLHDDVVDNSALRRGKPTANTNWGNAPSILVGDFLYSRAFQQMVKIGNLGVMDILADATNVIAEGEVHQLTRIGDANTTEAQYLEVIYAKTAMLFEAASHSGAVLAGASDEICEAMKIYGACLGNAFQLVDDILDYEGDAKTMGKNVGDDLAEGKPTLPLIYAMQQGTEADQKLIRQAIRKPSADNFDPVMEILIRTKALEYVRNHALEEARLATESLDALPASEWREALEYLAQSVVKRIH